MCPLLDEPMGNDGTVSSCSGSRFHGHSLSLCVFLGQRREALPLTIGIADNLASLSCILPASPPSPPSFASALSPPALTGGGGEAGVGGICPPALTWGGLELGTSVHPPSYLLQSGLAPLQLTQRDTTNPQTPFLFIYIYMIKS